MCIPRRHTKKLDDVPSFQKIEELLRDVNLILCKFPQMCANLVSWQELCGTDQVTVKKVCQTRWMSNFACLRNHNRIMPALLGLLQTVSKHSNVYLMLTNLENQLVIKVYLHMLEQLNSLLKLCQGCSCDVHLIRSLDMSAWSFPE